MSRWKEETVPEIDRLKLELAWCKLKLNENRRVMKIMSAAIQYWRNKYRRLKDEQPT